MTDTDHDLIAFLAAYGAFVERESGEQLRPSPDEVEFIHAEGRTEPTEIIEHRSRFEPRRLLLAATAVLLIAGGLFAIQGLARSNGTTLVTADAPVPGPLLVLPDSSTEWEASNGFLEQFGIQEDSAGTGPLVGGVIGQPDSDGYVDVIRISVLSRSAFLNEGDLEQVGESTIYRQIGDRMGERLIQDRGAAALSLSTVNGLIDQPGQLFDQIRITQEGRLEVGTESGLVLIDQWAIDPTVLNRWSTSFDLTMDGRQFFVETADVPAAFALDIGDRVDKIVLGDRTAWLAEVDGTSYGIAWQATPTQSIFISPLDDEPFTTDQLIAVAESLQIADRNEWFAEFPTLQDPESE